MSPFVAIILTGAVLGGGLYLLVQQFIPGVPALSRALERLNTEPAPPLDLKREAPLAEQVGTRLQRQLGSRGNKLILASDADLEILDKPRSELLGEKAVSAAIGFLLGPISYVMMILGGVGIGYLLPAGMSLAFAVAGWYFPDLNPGQSQGRP